MREEMPDVLDRLAAAHQVGVGAANDAMVGGAFDLGIFNGDFAIVPAVEETRENQVDRATAGDDSGLK